ANSWRNRCLASRARGTVRRSIGTSGNLKPRAIARTTANTMTRGPRPAMPSGSASGESGGRDDEGCDHLFGPGASKVARAGDPARDPDPGLQGEPAPRDPGRG